MRGGMWGGIGGSVPDMAALVEKWYKAAAKRPAAELADDRAFLKEVLWPRLSKEGGSKALLGHDSYCCEKQVRRRW